MSPLVLVLLSASILSFGWRRVLQHLRFFQQEGYTNKRYLQWFFQHRAFDTRFSLALLTLWFITENVAANWARMGASVLISALLITLAFIVESDPRRTGKIRLVMTTRAKKLAYLTFGLLVSSVALAIVICHLAGLQGLTSTSSLALSTIFAIQIIPLLLIAANILLLPFESRIQGQYKAEAVARLNEYAPYTVGITGSYGKTGAKAVLAELLTQCLGPTYWPRQGINTIMGITRSIRETLTPFHRYAVIEMGAYHIGSIKRLCDFTPPQAALVTSVGIMHLERFGSAENVYHAKSEIAQAVPADGVLVCNGDSPNARRMAKEHPKAKTLLYGLDRSAGHLDTYASQVQFSPEGTSFVIHTHDHEIKACTPLLGRPALLNILGAYTMACALGAEPHYAAACLANLTPVDNRLVYDKQPFISYLRDAYNSNPIGFAAALEVLQNLPATRRILMTPGMIELGDAQYEENRRAASLATDVADLVLVVGTTNRQAILDGLQQKAYAPEKTIIVDSRDEAFEYIRDNGQKGDLILLENDLGDLHEARVRF